MTAIVSVDFDWSIESRDKAPRDLDYERNTEKYGRAMKLTIDMAKRSSTETLYRLMRPVNEWKLPHVKIDTSWVLI